MKISDSRGKITAEHLKRMACVYVRQSSPEQVRSNTESTRRQYELADRAVEMGWTAGQVRVIDEDQGQSGSLPNARRGFLDLVASAARGELGIVIGLEVSRLARNSPDWSHLLYMCRWTGTLIADEHGVYDPADSADRMVLGVRGQISELERDNAVHRMVEARWSKARRGELNYAAPAGYDLDDVNQVVMSSDESIAEAVRTVFRKFEELGSARQVVVWWREQERRFPVRVQNGRSHPVEWREVKYGMILRTLKHPIYAGAYVFGRSETVHKLDPDDRTCSLRKRRMQRAEWPVLIQDHHEAYIPFAKYVEIQERIRGNAVMSNGSLSTETSPFFMRSSKAETHTRVHALPEIRFDDQRLTSCSGLAVFQSHFQALMLRDRLRSCFSRANSGGAYGMHTIFLLLVVHVLIGHRKLRDSEYYKDDPMVLRVLGLHRLPEVSTISRALASCDESSCRAIDAEIASQVVDRLAEAGLSRVTLDFDGSVCGTRRQAEGTAVGYNTKRKGERSYYPLICSVAQTGQVLGFLQRPGNVHDSHDSQEFMVECFATVIGRLPRANLESRLDSAHFSEETASLLDRLGVEFTIAVPFLRLPALKEQVENRKRWSRIDSTWSYFELEWAPKSWISKFRFLVVRQQVPERRRGPLQLDLFEPKTWKYDYKVVMTNKTVSAGAVLRFHHGRGSQEGILGELKADSQFDYIPVQHKLGNRLFCQAAVMAHNLSRDLQITTMEMERATTPTRATHWVFEKLSTLRNRIIRRAGRLTRPNGTLVLTMSANPAAQKDILRFLEAS